MNKLSDREKPALPIARCGAPIPRASPRTLTTTKWSDALLPTIIFAKHTHLRPKTDIEAYLRSDLNPTQLNAIHHLLWLTGLPNAARPLHRQKLLGRSILITEDPNEHLVWFEKEMYIKPLPEYIFEYDFWIDSICKDHELRLSACGLLLSYVWLVQHKSDLAIAQETGLLPKDIEWSAWTQFVETFLTNVDLQTLEDVNKRYQYGELRLSRLNSIYQFLPPKYTLHNLFRGYRNGSTWYRAFFTRHFQWLLAVFALVSIALSALQVGLATERLQADRSFQAASFGTAIASLVAIIVSMVVVLCLWATLFLYHLISSRQHNKAVERTRRSPKSQP